MLMLLAHFSSSVSSSSAAVPWRLSLCLPPHFRFLKQIYSLIFEKLNACLLSSSVVSWGISVESAFHSHTLKWVAPRTALLCSALNLAATCWHYGGRCDILAVRLLSLPRAPILRPMDLRVLVEKTITRLSSAALAAQLLHTRGADDQEGSGKRFFFNFF